MYRPILFPWPVAVRFLNSLPAFYINVRIINTNVLFAFSVNINFVRTSTLSIIEWRRQIAIHVVIRTVQRHVHNPFSFRVTKSSRFLANVWYNAIERFINIGEKDRFLSRVVFAALLFAIGYIGIVFVDKHFP